MITNQINKREVKKKLFFVWLLAITGLGLKAQTITGTVSASGTGEVLIGATVMNKSTENGTVTDIDGNYELSNVGSNDTLIISYVGYQSQEVPVNNRSTVNVALEVSSETLDEVVVVGYGSVKKSDLTGSVASIKGGEISAFPTTNLAQSLQGRAAGVLVQQNTGAPGASMQIRIRGTNSIRGSNEPLWVIDGFPGDPNMLNNSDIESIEILKDASATAIYGSRGANGVVLVTTKQGSIGATKIQYEGSYSTQSLIKKLDLMNAKEYAEFVNLTRLNDDEGEYFIQEDINDLGKGTDWQDLIFRKAPVYQHNLSVQGGSQKMQFLISGSYFDQSGIIENSDFQRMNLKGNFSHQINEKLDLSYNVILSRINNNPKNSGTGNRGNSLISSIVSNAPTLSPYNDDGSYRLLAGYYPFSSNVIMNPMAYVNEVSEVSYSNRINANLAFDIKPLNDLSVKISGNVRNIETRADNYTTLKYPTSSGSASVNTNQNLYLNVNNIITYNKIFNDSHNYNFTGGITYENSVSTGLSASGTGFLSDVTETYNIGSATNIGTPSTSYSDWILLSFLGRMNYSYKNKYLITASIRADGSSRYSKGSKWGYFPSGALAWRISDENFMGNMRFISDMKLRMGYGETGSTAISPYYTLDMLSSGKTTLGMKELYTYFVPGTRLPTDLKWETTAQVNIGLDLGIMNNRFRLTADFYNKLTRDLLNSVQLPASLGYTTTVRNVGEIRNKGIELQLDANIFSGIFQWDVSGNISFNQNKVEKLYEGQDILGITSSGLTVVIDNFNILREGHPMGVFYGYKEAGYDEKGYPAYLDINGDGEISPDDKTFIGDPNPQFIYGLTSEISWGNFGFNFFIQGTYGSDIMSFSMINQTLDYGMGLNTFKEVLYDHWSPGNPGAKYPIISRNTPTKMSDRFVYDGSYLRLKHIQLTYSIPTDNINWLSHAQLYLSGQNLLTITSYPWFDPEVNTLGGASSINQGVDWYSYPTAKGVTMGVKLSF